MQFLCIYCNLYVYDEERGDISTTLKPGTTLVNIPEDWKCPICGQSKSQLKNISAKEFIRKESAYQQVYDRKKVTQTIKKDLITYRNIARELLIGVCSVNKVCDGHPDRLCMGQHYDQPIGFGGVGQGATFHNNFQALAKYRIKMKLVKKHQEPRMETSFLGKPIVMPVMVSSISGVKLSMN